MEVRILTVSSAVLMSSIPRRIREGNGVTNLSAMVPGTLVDRRSNWLQMFFDGKALFGRKKDMPSNTWHLMSPEAERHLLS